MIALRALTAASLLVLGVAGGGSAQSLWREGVSGANLYADLRARAVNDVITVLIVEQSSSSRSANTTTSKDTSRTAAINNFPGAGLPSSSQMLRDNLKFDISGSASQKGKGSIERTDRVSGQIAARVVKVFDNGNLLIEGRRQVLVNDETQVITISGLVRPQDITAANTVLSSQIADAEVQMVGRGLLAEGQRPGILFRVLDWLRLF